MKNNNQYLTALPLLGMSRFIAMFLLLCSLSAQATAPRINAGLFGEETKADVVGYQSRPMAANTKSESALTVEIVTEAFNAAGKSVVVDILPSNQLAKYALVNNDAIALIGIHGDLTGQESSQYRVVTFYLRVTPLGEEPISLIFSKKNSRGDELHQAFTEGLQKIIKSGKYMEILEKHLGKGHVPTDYERRLRRSNPSLK